MFRGKYGVALHIYIPVIKRGVVDFAVSGDWTPAAGDVKISKDGGAAANVTNLPVAITMGNGAMWDFSMTATEMQAAKIMVTVVDSATKAVEDTMFVIETHGNASALMPMDFSDSVRGGLTALPNAAAEAAGGLYTRGSGAGQINQAANGNIDTNAVKVSGTAQTGRDLGASVLLSPGTGTGQLDITSGVVKASLVQILGTALTETSGYLAAGFKKFFNVAAPAHTVASVDQTGDSYARLGAPAGASVSADVAAVKTDTAAVKTQTDKLAFTVTNQVDANVIDWKGSAAPAMTGDAYARLGAPAGASVSADVAAVKADTGGVKTQTDKLAFSVANQVDANVIDWKGSAAPAMTGDAYARIGALGAGLTALGDARLANLDAAVSTRSTYAGADTSGTTTLLSRIASALTITGGKVDINDKTGFALSAPGVQAIWDAATSALVTAGSIGLWLVSKIDAAVSSRSTLDAAGTRAAVGLASANLDTQLAAVPTANANADALLDRANGVETSYTLRQSLRLMLAALAGKVSGAGTTTVTLRDVNDTADRVVATVDAYGNRLAVTKNVS